MFVQVLERNRSMQILQADCTVEYKGRGHTFLERGVRLILVKDDGSVAIHQDKGMKPLNYMSKSTEIESWTDPSTGRMRFYVASKTESLDIDVFELLFEQFLDFPDEHDLTRYGTEKQLQAWLANDDNLKATVGDDVDFVTREYQTGKGPVDILGRDNIDNQACLIEVKRYAKKNDSFQLVRYKTSLEELRDEARACGDGVVRTTAVKGAVEIPVDELDDMHMLLVAPKFHRGVEAEAEKRGIRAVKMGDGWMETADFSIGGHKDEIVGGDREAIIEEEGLGAELEEAAVQPSLFDDDLFV